MHAHLLEYTGHVLGTEETDVSCAQTVHVDLVIVELSGHSMAAL